MIENECIIAIVKAIICCAGLDRRHTKYKQDVKEFFASQWGKDLCALIGKNAQDAIAHLDEPLPQEFYNTLK